MLEAEIAKTERYMRVGLKVTVPSVAILRLGLDKRLVNC